MGPKRTSVVAHPAHKATTFTFQIYIPAHFGDVYNGVLPCQPYGLSANKTARRVAPANASFVSRRARRSAAVNHDLAAAISVNHLQCGAGGYLPITAGPRQRTAY
jgi:hypothetical protein